MLKKFCIGLCCIMAAFSLVGCVETPRWTITFDTGEGGSYVPSQSIQDGKTAKCPETNPTREGFTFVDWFGADIGGWSFWFSAPITVDITLYAGWRPNWGYDDVPEAEALTEEVEIQIRQDYYDQFFAPFDYYTDYYTLEDISILTNYGTFNDCVVVNIRVARMHYTGGGWRGNMGGIVFNVGTDRGTNYMVWKDGKFYELDEACKRGFFTTTDLCLLYKRSNTKPN